MMAKAVLTRPDGTVVLAEVLWDVAVQGFGATEVRIRAKGNGHAGYLLRAGDRNVAYLPAEFAGKPVASFADVIADAIDDSFAGVFMVGGQCVYVAMTEDGYVLADGDRVYDKIGAAKTRLLAERSLYPKFYCPPSWEIPGALDSDAALEEIVWDNGGLFQHLSERAPNRKKAIIAGATALACVVAGAGGWQLFQSREDEEALPASAPPPPPLDPWLSESRPEAAANACLEVRAAITETAHQGWRLADLTCDLKGRSVFATLSPYTLANQPPVLPPGLTSELAPDAMTIIVTGPLKVVAADRHLERSSTANAIAFRNTLFALVNKPGWQSAGRQVSFEFTTPIPLTMIAEKVGKYQTVGLSKIEYLGDKWRVQGNIYK